MTNLNSHLFQVYLPDEKTPEGVQEDPEDEDMFSRAFQEQVNLGL
jgi:hypothetical protein